MKRLDLRRHAKRNPAADELSPEGRVQAEDTGRKLPADYAVMFCSPAKRAAETIAWFLRGSGQSVPPHRIIEGLASDEEVAGAVESLFDLIPEGGSGLAVGHTPLIEKAVERLSGVEVEPLGECEGVALTLEDGSYRVERLQR
ncbi:MAG: histidine phosphatase family protein [Actinomycetota bacterium]